MNYNFLTNKGGGVCVYSAPDIEVISINAEKGFAASPENLDYGDSGVPGLDPDVNDNGDY